MLKTQTKQNSEVQRIIDKYGEGFDVIYFDGKADGKTDGKLEVVKKGLANGIDEETISILHNDFSIDQIKNIKRKLKLLT